MQVHALHIRFAYQYGNNKLIGHISHRLRILGFAFPHSQSYADMSAMNDSVIIGDRYVLKTGEAGASRLELLDRVYGPDAKRFLSQIGIPRGGRAADIGCGTGTMTVWLAKAVGSEGEAVGLDISADQTRIAAQRAFAQGAGNVRFGEASAYETDLPRASFDIVHCRYLLCHLTRPVDALREMASLLKPGGALACFDADLTSLFSVPPSRAYARVREIFMATGFARGVDYALGLKLPRLFRSCGFAEPEIAFIQPAYFRGEEKRLWEHSFLEAAPAMITAGTTSQDEVTILAAELAQIARDESIFVAQARMPAVWARRA
jgi:SAM-dependent methyltransferase